MQLVDRARHSIGQSQEDMYMIRSDRISEIHFPDVAVFPKIESKVGKVVVLAHKVSLSALT